MTDRRFIVVVDDDKSVCKALERLLRTAQMDVETYSSVDKFLLRIDGREPDCLVLDIRMPEVTGTERRERLGRMGSRIPVVITTTNGVEPARHAAGGIQDVLHKPFDDLALLDAIDRAIDGQGAR